MYRAVALHLLHLGATADSADLADILRSFDLDVVKVDGNVRVTANGTDVTEEIRTPEVGTMASRISSNGAIRAWMVERQRSAAASMSASGGIVVEGRDIGTVVFPGADLKVYMDARDEIRAERRLEELKRQGVAWSLEAVRTDLASRDARDLQREIAPLRRADDAIVIDTSDLSFEQQVEQIVAAAQAVRTIR
jgi:cytidylate kinase